MPGASDVALSGVRLIAPHAGFDVDLTGGLRAGPWLGGALDLLSASYADGGSSNSGTAFWWQAGIRVEWSIALGR